MKKPKYVIRDLIRDLYYIDHPMLGGVRLATLQNAKTFNSFAEAASSLGFKVGLTRIVQIPAQEN